MNNEYNLSILEALFKDYLSAEKISKVSIKNYRSDIKHFLNWFYIYIKPHLDSKLVASTPVSYIHLFIDHSQAELIESYKSYLKNSNIPVKTINRRLSAIRRFYVFCVKRGYLDHNPAQLIPNVKNKPTVLPNFQLKPIILPADQFKIFLSESLNMEKQAAVLKDIEEFNNLWN